MNCKPVALALMAAFCSSSAFAVDPITVKGGTIKFSGSLVNGPCVIDQPSGGLVVDLKQHKVSDLNSAEGAVSRARDFTINLTECATDVFKKASVSFQGKGVEGKNTILALDAGGASGVGIQILSDGNAVPVDGSAASAGTELKPGNTQMKFQAQYISTSKGVKPGAANASTEFTITYS